MPHMSLPVKEILLIPWICKDLRLVASKISLANMFSGNLIDESQIVPRDITKVEDWTCRIQAVKAFDPELAAHTASLQWMRMTWHM